MPEDRDTPRPRKAKLARPQDDEDDDDRPRRRREEDDEDDDDRPRRRRRDDEGDVTGGVIPYRNAKALAAYYCGVFALIPCVGNLLGPLAIILGFLGLGHAKRHPKSKGQVHATIGITLGLVAMLLYNVLPLVLFMLGVIGKK